MAKTNSQPSNKGGRPRSLTEAEAKQLVAHARSEPTASLAALVEIAEKELGRRISRATAQRVLRDAGVLRVTRPRAVTSPSLPPFRYPSTKRSDNDPSRYPTMLFDAEWALLAPVFARRNARGRPERYTRRQMLEAIHFVLRSGCPWRMLPKDDPPWQIVYATFRRWAKEGRFEVMHDLLRARWRERQARDASPSAAVLDSQSVRTAEKGASAVSMRRKRSRDASAIL